MATINPTISLVGKQDGSSYAVIWALVTETDTCAPISLPEYSDKSVICSGTFASGSVAIQGSNDGTNYVGLADPGGTTIAITTAGAKAILENTVWVKPVITGGGGTQEITVAMLFHLANPMRQ